MKLIAGLGNPGSRYERTFHNAGFMALDILADELGIKFKTKECLGLTARGRAGGQDVILLKPQTFMNLSGDSVNQALKKYRLTAEDLAVIYDDFDIERGVLRIRGSGSAGTHNGMKSVISALGTDCFTRIRVGIGKSPNPEIPVADYVLSKIPRDFEDAIEIALCSAVRAAAEFASGEPLDRIMQRYNGTPDNGILKSGN